jgi:hypothetical protein
MVVEILRRRVEEGAEMSMRERVRVCGVYEGE